MNEVSIPMLVLVNQRRVPVLIVAAATPSFSCVTICGQLCRAGSHITLFTSFPALNTGNIIGGVESGNRLKSYGISKSGTCDVVQWPSNAPVHVPPADELEPDK